MENTDTLLQLIEQAACCVNILEPQDLSEAENLSRIIEQLQQYLDRQNDCSSDNLLEQVRQVTSQGAGALQMLIEQDVENTAQALEAVTAAICVLQGLADQITSSPQASLQSQPCGSEASGQSGESSVLTHPEDCTADAPVIPEEDVPLVMDFITESLEHIASAESGLLELESNPDDKELLNRIFRSFHTIKGMAGFLNLNEIGSLAHAAENLLDLARKGQLILAGQNTDIIFESIDTIKHMMTVLKDAVETGKAIPSQKNLQELLDRLKTIAQTNQQDNNTGTTQQQNTAVEELQQEFVTDSAESIENDRQLDEILSVDESQDVKKASTQQRAHREDEKIKVSTTRLDNLINMVGELVIAQSMVSEEARTNLSDHELGRKVSHLSKIVRELQELSMSMRMVPIQGVFQKMARLVRDVSRKAGKNIDFVTQGEETELDRNIVDKIADPLIHMIRNSVDHGIEEPQEREKAGKNPTGRLELRAFHQSGNIVIEIQDDGKGLNKEKILKKAINNGLVEPGQELSEEQIFRLIFNAGLSTAEKITSISGRGVGMDVVRKNIESLRGKIEISSVPGQGTTFTIRLPLTLAIIDGQMVRVGSQRYIIPINSIIQSFRPTESQVSTIQDSGEMVMIRGRLMPIVRLYSLFSIEPETTEPTQALLVEVEEDGKRLCLLVDDLLGQQQVVIKNLGEGLGTVEGISGGAIMGDGHISLILDIAGLIELGRR